MEAHSLEAQPHDNKHPFNGQRIRADYHDQPVDDDEQCVDRERHGLSTSHTTTRAAHLISQGQALSVRSDASKDVIGFLLGSSSYRHETR